MTKLKEIGLIDYNKNMRIIDQYRYRPYDEDTFNEIVLKVLEWEIEYMHYRILNINEIARLIHKQLLCIDAYIHL